MHAAPSKWICCQLGAREHYAVPRALQLHGRLKCVVTDAWVPPGSLFRGIKRSLRERFHADLHEVDVHSANVGLLLFEFSARTRGLRGWNLTMARNRWFQQQAIRKLKTEMLKTERPTVFAYSYAALEILRWAKAQGCRTVLGQIDPGLPEERLVAKLHETDPARSRGWKPAPTAYWEAWQEECDLADCIVVNSDWSRSALASEGIAKAKIRVVPLAYATPTSALAFQRTTPEAFTSERPLRALFLGQINLRKGVGSLLDAVRLLRGAPIEFWFVGPEQIAVPADLKRDPQVRWFGPVARGAAPDFFRQADVFLFPTLSDGFGLTQLEAQAWHLPVVASRNCGEVVRDGVNGVLLPEVSGKKIASVLRALVRTPALLRQMAKASQVDAIYCLDALAVSLVSL